MSPEARVTGTAKVRVVVEVSTGSWGADCTLEQLHKQAGESAMAQVEAALSRDPYRAGRELRVVSAEVLGVITKGTGT